MVILEGENIENPKFLLVDDISENLFALEHLLQEMELDCDIVKTQSGAEALKLMKQDEFALVLLDIMMPEMDGYEVAKQIRERGLDKELPIIFMTAETGPKPLESLWRQGQWGLYKSLSTLKS